MNRLEILSQEPMFWSRVGMTYDPVRIDSNGNIMFYEQDWSVFLEEHKSFLNAGVRVHTSILHNGWVGVDKYDYSAVDKTLDAVCGISEKILYIPRIKLNVPVEWCIKNPAEVSLTFEAPRTPEKISTLVEKLTEYYETSGILETAPKDEGLAGLQSFSSDKWIEDASEALKRLINHIETGKYKNQVIGYQIGFGMCAETCWWGAWSDSRYWGDYGITNSKKFYNFCLKKYKNIENIQKVFNRDNITTENIVPHFSKRKYEAQTLEEYFRKDCEEAIAYSEFVSDMTVNAIDKLALVVKENAPEKLVGSFYGYIINMYPTETGHVGIEKLLDSDNIDFLASPKGYYRCGPGEPGGTQSTSMSVTRKKIWLDELDNDTHIAKSYHDMSNHPKNIEETKTVLWRETARNLSWNNQNFWWMDLLGGWFHDGEIMDEIKKIVEFIKKVRKKEYKSISEILLVLDEKSLIYQNCDENMMGAHHKGIIDELCCEAHLCGAPVDEYRLTDLKDMDLSQYKMIIFANAFMIDKDIREIIKNAISKNTLCIWNYAAGIRNPDYNSENVKDITGMDILPYKIDYKLNNGYGVDAKLPPIQIKAEEAIEVIERYDDGAIKTAKCRNNILAASPDFYAKDFHKYAKECGCHMYASYDCTVYADNRFVGIFPRISKKGRVMFPQKGIYKDIISSKLYNKENETEFKEKSVMLFFNK